jgi:linoleoyl-CoA desaturase
MQVPRFSSSPEFYNDLRSRVNSYFEETNQVQTGNWKLFSKAVILLSLHIIFYSVLVFFKLNGWVGLLFCVLLGLTTTGIGFNIMHDGNHGSFSKNKFLNKLAGFTLNIIGGNDYLWKFKHNVLHHSFTNIDGVDDDIKIGPLMRMCNTQKHYWFHRFQSFYFVLLYSLLYITWMFFFDYKKYFMKEINGFEFPKMKFWDHISFWGGKAISYFLFLVLPIIMVGAVDFLIGFLVFMFVTGFVISIIFQLAHTVEHAEFPIPTDSNKIENEWAIHQIQTTANFATRNPIWTWFCGGLNFQIEHHLFPSMSHIHYPKISKIVKETCAEHGVFYNEFPRFRSAVASHWKFLNELGKRK